MTRIVKCQQCGVSDTPKSDMEFITVGQKNPVKKYYHKSCFKDYLIEKEFKDKEATEKDELVEKIKEIYGVKEISRSSFPLIEKLRNGQTVFGGQKVGKRYKEGYKYSLIKETFEYVEDTINYWNSVKNFESFSNAFRYGLSIVIDKIYYVEQRAKEREAREKMMEAHVEEVNSDVLEHAYESNYKKKDKLDNDISSFLDD